MYLTDMAWRVVLVEPDPDTNQALVALANKDMMQNLSSTERVDLAKKIVATTDVDLESFKKLKLVPWEIC